MHICVRQASIYFSRETSDQRRQNFWHRLYLFLPSRTGVPPMRESSTIVVFISVETREAVVRESLSIRHHLSL